MEAVTLEVFSVFDIVPVAVAFVTHNNEAEHIFHRVFPSVKRAARNLLAFAQLGFRPLAVDFLQGDFLGAIERFYEPDVFVDLIL